MTTRGQATIARLALSMVMSVLMSCTSSNYFNYDFESDASLDQIEWSCRTLFALSTDNATDGKMSLKVSMYPAAGAGVENYPGVTFEKFDRDWSGRHALAFDAFNPESAPLPVELRIDDRKSADYADRFNGTYLLPPGQTRVSIPLASLRTTGTRRRLDLRRIQVVSLFLVNPRERHTIYLDRVRLE